jgi:hypothetical protein
MIAQAALALQDVFRRPRYVFLAAMTAAIVLILALWLPNVVLLREIGLSDSVPLAAKLRIFAGLIGSITTNYSFAAGAALVLASLLFGVNVSLFFHGAAGRWRAGRFAGSGLLATFGGLASSSVGIGCAACGTFVLGPVLTLLGAGSLMASFPFGGEEFIVIGIGLLAIALVLQARAIAQPIVCAPQQSGQLHYIKEDR